MAKYGTYLFALSPLSRQHSAWLRVGFGNELMVKNLTQRSYLLLIHLKI